MSPDIQPPEVKPLIAFRIFGNLPVEVIEEIWSFACHQEAFARAFIVRIAPDPLYGLRKIEHAKIRVLCPEPCAVPAMLQVCKSARKVALKHWSLWPCASLSTNDPDGTNVYVNKTHDTFYFGASEPTKFWFLNCLEGPLGAGETQDVRDAALLIFTSILENTRHWAFDWWVWFKIFVIEGSNWIRNLHGMQEMTLVIRNPTPWKYTKIIPKFCGATAGTIRAESVKNILAWMYEGEGDARYMYFNHLSEEQLANGWQLIPIPPLNILAILGKDEVNDENSQEDRIFLDTVRKQLRWSEIHCDIADLIRERDELRVQMDSLQIPFPESL